MASKSQATVRSTVNDLTKLNKTMPTLDMETKSLKRSRFRRVNSPRTLRTHSSGLTIGGFLMQNKMKRKRSSARIVFTVIGNRTTKEFIYCVKMVQGMHKYRWRSFGPPIIQGVTGVDWPLVLNKLKIKYGNEVYALEGQVAVLKNGWYLGGEKELKNFIEEKYIYHVAINYPYEGFDLFRHYVESTGRTCAYLHISVDDYPIGCLVFMLFSDLCPRTCENFLRLCQTKKGGYSGTPVHRIVEDGWIQCGGFELKDTPLDCENFIVPHDRRGVLGMCNDGRGVDCSTQFYIILQPASWMDHKYVAFGQLIEGQETLKRIEEVPSYAESPSRTITIFKAGVLNLDCDDIMINRGAVAYIDMHIDDIISIGEMLWEWLMQHVETEIDAREMKIIESVVSKIMDVGAYYEGVKYSHKTTPTAQGSIKGEFSGEDNLYIGEAYSYQKDTYYSETKQKHPYYIPLTDVPYPGEKDSNYDLKRYLQGNYCLEADLDPDYPKSARSIVTLESQQSKISDVMLYYMDPAEDSSSSSSSSSDMEDYLDDPDELRSIEEYLEEYGGKVSFSGRTVKYIGKKYINSCLRNPKETLADEDIRKMRLAIQDLKAKESKKVSISTSPWETHSQIKRRQTGFFRPDEDNENDADVDNPDSVNKVRSVLINEPDGIPHSASKIRRRPTGFVSLENVVDDDDEDNDDFEPDEKKKEKVRISPDDHAVQEYHVTKTLSGMRVSKFQSALGLDNVSGRKTRPSVLIRLYEDVAVDTDAVEPMLKDYKPKEVKKNMFSCDNMQRLLKKGTPRFSTVGEIGHIGKEPIREESTQGYKNQRKSRPTLTVTAYKLKNKAYAEKMKEENRKNK